MKQNTQTKRLVIVSNRLPVSLEAEPSGELKIKAGSGGLVTAMAPVLRNRGGLWIGWPGMPAARDSVETDRLLRQATRDYGYTFQAVPITREELEGYYYGFANEIIWPLFHDLQTRCNFDPGYWHIYQQVNRKFAEVIARFAGNTEDHIWIHDYHLMGVGGELRRMGITSKIGYYLHIPFPPLDLFLKLPWRFPILRAFLEHDLIGFQTQRDRRNFIQCARTMLKDVRVTGSGQILEVQFQARRVRVGNFPISIDFDEFAQQAHTAEVVRRVEEIHQSLKIQLNGGKIVLGVDRLDYTKGIPERLRAFRNLLERFPGHREKIILVQVVVPSRVHIPRYNDLKIEIEQMVSEINGRFTQPGWTPISYIFRAIERAELIALYRAADIALVTPLKDGMNLIAKEYCASNVNEEGVLILSEFAGVATQMYKDALLVNPYDEEGIAEVIHHACQIDPEERRARMRSLRRGIRKYDIHWWVDSFLEAVFAHDLKDFPPLSDYTPTESAGL